MCMCAHCCLILIVSYRYKAHYGIGPGLSGCTGCDPKFFPDVPLIFDVEKDPQEAFPLTDGKNMPSDPTLVALVKVGGCVGGGVRQ